MQNKLTDLMKINTDVPEVNSALKSIQSQIETVRNHLCSLPFESEPSEFIKVLSAWQSKKEHPEDNDGG